MSVLWPTTLPECPIREGFSVQHVDNAVRSKTDVGPGKTRRRATTSPINIECSVIVDQDQRATLQSFYNDTMLSGTLRFIWPGMDYGAGGTYAYQFMSPPSHVPYGMGWKTRLKLTAWAPTGEAKALLYFIDQGFDPIVADSITFYSDFTQQVYIG